MKKQLLILVALLFVAFAGWTATINVPGDYPTIQAAINAASPGDIIQVAAGTYDENVTINKANLTLKSVIPLGAIIRPTTTAPDWPSAVVLITSNGVTVDGFEIDGTTVAINGIYGYETNGLMIKNNKIHGAIYDWDGCGILLLSWGNSGTIYNNTIQNNEVYDCGRMGIMVMDNDATNYTITSGNTIHGNKVHDVWEIAWYGDEGGGIQINAGKNCAITNNEVYNVQNGNRGIYMFGSAAGNTITGNIVHDNTTGIELWINGNETTPEINWGSETPTSPLVNSNNIYNNTIAITSTNILGTPMVLNATCNWYGTTVPADIATKINGSVTYIPYNLSSSGPCGGGLPVTITRSGSVIGGYSTIQAAITAAISGDIIKVYPGTYNETAPNSSFNGATYQFGLFFSALKSNITVEGCKTDGTIITNTADIAAFITTNATNTFGYSGTFVVGNNITLRGLEFGSNIPSDDKAIEVLGNGFTIDACRITANAPIYFGDYNYNENGTPSDFSDDISSIQSYTISNCNFAGITSTGGVYIANGAGWTGSNPALIAGRSITGCTFDGMTTLSFAGLSPGYGWLLYPTGAATVTGNTFTNATNTRYIQSWGVVQAQFPYASYFNDNTFPKKVITTTDGNANNIRGYDASTSYLNLKRIGTVIQPRIDNAQAGDVILVGAGTYSENLNLTKNLTIQGAQTGANRPVIAGLITKDGALSALDGMVLKNLIFRHTGAMLDFAAGTNISGNGLVFDGTDFDFIGTTTPTGPSSYNAPLTFVSMNISGTTGLKFINSTLSISGTPTLNGLFSLVWMQPTGGPILFDGLTVKGSYTDGTTVMGAQFNMGTGATNVELKNSSTLLGGNFYLSGVDGLNIHNNIFSNSGMGLNDVQNVTVSNNTFQNIDQTYKCGGPGPTNRVIQMEAAWGDATFKLKNININNNTFTNINNVHAVWVTRYTTAAPTSITFSNVHVNNNDFSSVIGTTAVVSDYATAIPDATCNWWGTTDPIQIQAKVSGTAILSPFLVTNNIVTPNCSGNFPAVNQQTGIGYASIQPAIDAAATGQTIQVDVAGTYTGVHFSNGITVTLTNTSNGVVTIVGSSPALTVASGDVTLNGFNYITATDDPTVLVSGGKLTLRNCTVTGTSGYPQPAISITGGELDAGTLASNGHNKIYKGAGKAINNSGGTANAIGNYWGTAVGSEVLAQIVGTVPYDPWCNIDFSVCHNTTAIVTTIGTPVATLGTTCGVYDVPVTVQNFTSVGSISLKLNYDPAVFTYTGVTLNLAISSALVVDNGGQINLAYADGDKTLANGDVLFTLHFTLLPTPTGASTNLTWSTVPEDCQYAGSNGEIVYVSTFVDKTSWAIPTRPVVNTTTHLEYCKIQDAINATQTVDGNTITVAAGTYAENIDLTKRLIIYGVNHGINPNTGTRVAESIIQPVTSNPDVYSSTEEVNIILEPAASGSIIDGFTIDGDNPNLTSGLVVNGHDIDACEAIAAWNEISNLTIQNNIIKNNDYAAIDLDNYTSGGTATTGNIVANNKFDNIMGAKYGYWGIGVLIYDNCYTNVANNVMTNIRTGVQTGNYYRANPGSTTYQLIDGNTMNVSRIGIFHNLQYSAASAFTFSNNVITALANANETKWDGITLSSLSVASISANNTINGNNITKTNLTKGYEIWNVKNTYPATISGGNISGVDLGVFANNFEGYNADAGDGAYAAVSNLTITPKTSGIGVRILDSPSSTSHAIVQVTVNNCFISGCVDGIKLEETSAGKSQGTFNNNSITGVSGYAINATTIANTVDATCNWYGITAYAGVSAKITGNVNYTPWLVSGVDFGGIPADGFQPVPGSCIGTPIVFTCGNNVTIPPCSAQTTVNAAYAAFIASTTASGCDGNLSNNAPISAPSICGGSVDVTWTYTSSCEPDHTCTKTFTVTPAPVVVFNCSTDITVNACSTQAQVDLAWTNFLASTTASGGCNGVLTNNGAGHEPPICGGFVDVTWTYASSCDVDHNCTKRFTVTAAPAIVFNCAVDKTEAACQTQSDINASFAAWILTTTASGGCNGVLTNNASTAPLACGGSTDVTWTYTSSCIPFITTCTKTFTVSTAPPLVLNSAVNTTVASCQTQTAIDALFATWLTTTTTSGGCNVVLTNGGFGYNTATLDGQNGWNGGIGGFTNNNAGDAEVVNNVAQNGTQSWYFKKGYNSPGQGSPFSPVVASVGAPGNGAAGDQSIIQLSFKPATLNDGSRITIYEGSMNRDDRTGANLYIQNLPGGLVQLYMFRSDNDGPTNDYSVEEIIGTYPANVWNTVKMVTDYPTTNNSDLTTWGTTKYYVNGTLVFTGTTWTHWWRHEHGFAYAPGSSIKFTNNNAGDGFYIDDVSMIVNNTLTNQTVGSFSTGFEPKPSIAQGPSACGGEKTVQWTATSSCEAAKTGVATFTVTPASDVVFNCAVDKIEAACQTQGVIDASFAAWLLTTTASGGCNGSLVTTPAIPTAPPACGGYVDVTWTYTSTCGTLSTNCTKRFTVTAAPAVVLTCAQDLTVASCQTQSAINTAYSNWLATASAIGGCNGVLTNNSTGAPLACGGSKTVIFTYTSSCVPLISTCSATFTVSPAPAVVLTEPVATTEAACQSQGAIDTKFATWLGTVVSGGGCNLNVTNNAGSAPSACGGSITVTWTATSSCEGNVVKSSTFTVTSAPTIVLTCASDLTVASCQTQSAINTAYTNWLATASAIGGCNGILTNNNTGAPLACGGSKTVIFTYTSSCIPYTTTCSATFTVTNAPAVIATQPSDFATTACTYANQTALNAAFANWLTGFGVSGGCSPSGSYGSPTAPLIGAGGTTTVTYNWSDLCQTGQKVATFTINPTQTLSGFIHYDNTANTVLNNVIVTLKQGSTTYGTATTDANGAYTINGLCPGIYNVYFSTVKPAGGVNATDASRVNFWGTAPYQIEKVVFYAGDAILDNVYTSGDAGRILQYFVTNGNPTWAGRDKWTFWPTNDPISVNPTVATGIQIPTVTMGVAPVTQNFWGLSTGDFNGSFVPGNAKSGSTSLTLNSGSNIQVTVGSDFELPIYAGMDMNVGAISLILDFPSSLLDVNGVYLTNDPTTPVQYSVIGNELRIGWISSQSIAVQNGAPMLTLQLKLNGPCPIDGILLTLAADPLNELADGNSDVIDPALLSVDKINSTILGISNNSLSDKLNFSNRPNPFVGTTTFAYSLPFEGNVTLEVYGLLGNKVKVAINEIQKAGNHVLDMDANVLAPGVYTAILTLKNNSTQIKRTIKIVKD